MAAGYFSLSLASLQPGKYRLNMLHPSTGAPEPHCWVKVGPHSALSVSFNLCTLLIAAPDPYLCLAAGGSLVVN